MRPRLKSFIMARCQQDPTRTRIYQVHVPAYWNDIPWVYVSALARLLLGCKEV